MREIKIVNESRRRFLQAGAGLTLAVYLHNSHAAPVAAAPVKTGSATPAAAIEFEPNAFVRIGEDNTVTIIAKHLEMGQGTYTGLATLVAEELDAAWPQIKVEGAPADAKRYNNLLWGPMQGTGGSSAMANSFEQMRRAGAAARFMLVAAAAADWGVPAKEITVKAGIVSHAASNRQASFGELSAKAALQEPPEPEDIKLKNPKDFVYIGKQSPRQDSKPKINGSAQFTSDVTLPGMLTALVAHPPRFGATVKSFDAAGAKEIAGVVDVVAIQNGVAVLAKDFWSAKKGRDALKVTWDESNAFKLGTNDILDHYKTLARSPGSIAHTAGDAIKTMGRAAKRIEAAFEFPYLAHAAMEPLNCVVKITGDQCEIWNGEQAQTGDQMNVSKLLGIPPENVKINMLYAGGSFGRRSNPHSDYVLEAVQIAKAIKGRVPVKMIWTREDDMRAGQYRPLFYHTLRAGLDGNGNLVAWQHRLVGQSIVAGTVFESGLMKNGIDATSVEGAANLPYAIPNMLVDLHTPSYPVPVQWWRSVGSTHTAFSTEVFFDEVAHAADKDPVAFRRTLLKDHPRHLAVLDLAASKAGWGKPLPAKAGTRRGRGVAVHESFGTVVAEVAEVSVNADGSFKVDRVVCAVDCGIAINPSIVRAQMEGGIGFGLSAALHSAVTLKDGQVEQSNFHDYPLLRMSEMPQIEVHIVPSRANPSGVGEPGVPPIAPAVVNALFAATGKRLRNLPLRTQDLV
ncbi:MAG TPA: xanthine dehydrogenase family protein molybdopterin-binding subunit [Thiobacillus sp.]|nr:xanthine dehydrogenase family protein molybdopterin-binding subunit [Thiobacillus sp.]